MLSTSTRRAAPALLAAGLAVAGLSGCSFSSDNVSCSTSSCSVTLTGDQGQADILGTTLTFGGVEDGRASLGVAGNTVSCAEGESVVAGPLELQCTAVSEDSVELTAALG